MAKPTLYSNELDKLTLYLKSDSNEDAKRQLLFPLFNKLFSDKFKTESDASGADLYVDGKIIVECKTNYSQWLDGFYQGLHYNKKHGLTFSSIMVIAHNFCGIWKLKNLPESAVVISQLADPRVSPSTVGPLNSRKTEQKTKTEIKDSASYWVEPKDFEPTGSSEPKSYIFANFEILKILKNLDVDRNQINTRSFIAEIELMKKYFDRPIDAVHAFYIMIPFWDITSTLSEKDNSVVSLVGFSGHKSSEDIIIHNRHLRDFKKFVNSRYIFKNEGSGLTVDYYFSRFDEVMAVIDPEYVKQHGIFFTDANLSRFALWFAKQHFPGNINDDYIVFDPAGGSGNLVSSWKGKLKHKIISELQPDLLRIIERRMKADPFHIETGFTIIPRTSTHHGLNFLDRSAEEYVANLNAELSRSSKSIDKPIAFLLNPPYKNTDENVDARYATDSNYQIHQTILDITGNDAGKERYLGFLGQILNISRLQADINPEFKSIVMVFTPTSWLIPRPTYVPFRQTWDQSFKFHSGFIITSNEFFKLKGRWPLAFTIWVYDPLVGHSNNVKLRDFTSLKKQDLNFNWGDSDCVETFSDNIYNDNSEKSALLVQRTLIKSLVPFIERNHSLVPQPRCDFSHAKTKKQIDLLISGFPYKDERHFNLSRVCGVITGAFVGFMDDITPVRVKNDTCNRMSNLPDRVWFQLRPGIIDINLNKVQSGPPDKYGYCAYDLESAKALFSWFSIAKILVGNYPMWANQLDLWVPKITPELQDYWYSLCFAFVLSENRCVVTKFEANNPVPGTLEIFVDNPLCPTNSQSFWRTNLSGHIIGQAPLNLVASVKELYIYWNTVYTQGQFIFNVGLQDESYFRYFDYPDFLTPHSGLVQIRKFAELRGDAELLNRLSEISKCTKCVKIELNRLLLTEFEYFN